MPIKGMLRETAFNPEQIGESRQNSLYVNPVRSFVLPTFEVLDPDDSSKSVRAQARAIAIVGQRSRADA